MTFRPMPKPDRKRPRVASGRVYVDVAKPAYLAGLAAGQGGAVAMCERCRALPAVEIHHRAGRIGGRLLAFETYAGLCRSCHAWVHSDVAEAYRSGWLLRRSSAQAVEDGDDATAEDGAATAEDDE